MAGNYYLWAIPSDMETVTFWDKFGNGKRYMIADVADMRVELGYGGGLSELPPREVWMTLTKIHACYREQPSLIEDALITEFNEAYGQEFDSSYQDEWMENKDAVLNWLAAHKGQRIVADYDG